MARQAANGRESLPARSACNIPYLLLHQGAETSPAWSGLETGQGSSYVDTVDGGEITGLGSAARSSRRGTHRGAAALQAVGFGNQSSSNWCVPWVPDTEGYIYFDSKSGFKLTSSFFVSSKLFIWKDDLEGNRRQTLKCLALSSAQWYFMHFLKGALAPWHTYRAAHSTHSVKIDFWSLWLQFTWKSWSWCTLKDEWTKVLSEHMGQVSGRSTQSTFGEVPVLRAVKGPPRASRAPQLGCPRSLPALGPRQRREWGEGPGCSQELGGEKPFSGHHRNPNSREQGCVKAPGKSPQPVLPRVLHMFWAAQESFVDDWAVQTDIS